MITITEFGSFSFGNNVSDPLINPSSTPNSIWTITSFTKNKLEASANIQGATATITVDGLFDLTGTNNIKTFADLDKLPFNKNNTISSQTFTFMGKVAATTVSDTPIQANIFTGASDSALVAQILYTGKLIFNSGNDKTSGSYFNGYSGYATYNNPHLYSSSENDTFVGGTGGINTLVIPGNKVNYSMVAKNVFDNNTLSIKGLNGWGLTDKTKTYASVDISNVQRIKFKDTSLALDVNDNAGDVAKVLGAVFGSSFATNKQYVGIGLDLMDKGINYSNLMGLALELKLGKNYTNEQEIQLLYQNLFGHTATINEVAAIDTAIKNGKDKFGTTEAIGNQKTGGFTFTEVKLASVPNTYVSNLIISGMSEPFDIFVMPVNSNNTLMITSGSSVASKAPWTGICQKI